MAFVRRERKDPEKLFTQANFHSVNCISLLLSYDDGVGSLETTEKVFSVLEDLVLPLLDLMLTAP